MMSNNKPLSNNPQPIEPETRTSADTIADPWAVTASPQPKTPRQVTLDLSHEVTAAKPLSLLSPEGDPTVPRIPAHASPPQPEPGSDPVEILLKDELRIDATQAKSLWDHIRDGLALFWWRGPQAN